MIFKCKEEVKYNGRSGMFGRNSIQIFGNSKYVTLLHKKLNYCCFKVAFYTNILKMNFNISERICLFIINASFLKHSNVLLITLIILLLMTNSIIIIMTETLRG